METKTPDLINRDDATTVNELAAALAMLANMEDPANAECMTAIRAEIKRLIPALPPDASGNAPTEAGINGCSEPDPLVGTATLKILPVLDPDDITRLIADSFEATAWKMRSSLV